MDDITRLPFAARAAAGNVDFWCVPEIAEYSSGAFVGRAHADRCVAFMQANRMPDLAGQVIAAIVRKGVIGPIETGFIHRLGEHAMRSDAVAAVHRQPVGGLLDRSA